MNTQIQAKLESDVQKFLGLIGQGKQLIIEAGAYLDTRCKEDPTFIDRICDADPDFTPEILERIRMVGTRKIHYQIYLSNTPGTRRLARLPFELQEQYISNRIPLVLKTDGGWDTLQADVRSLTPAQAAQVFTSDGIRSEHAQRTWIEDRLLVERASPAQITTQYIIRKKRLVITGPDGRPYCSFTASKLKKLLAQMEN